MSKKTILAIFANVEDAQKTLDEITGHGFDAQNASIITLDTKEYPEAEVDSTDYDSELEDFSEPETQGTIDPIVGLDVNQGPVTIPGVGDVILAGPLASMLDSEDIGVDVDPAENTYQLDELLNEIGISIEETTSYEIAIRNGSTFVAMPVDEKNLEEVEMLFSDNGPEKLDIIE